MKILGIDPGYDRCGVAVIEKGLGGKDVVIASGCITTSKNDAFEERLTSVVNEVVSWITTYSPDVCVLERLYFTKNQKTAMRVAETRGALVAAIHTRGIKVEEFGPGEIKVAVTGNGRATKQQVIAMIQRIAPIRSGAVFDDEYDAVAVALTASAILRR